jgi:D-amino-acid dehydrogenase
MRIAVIGAGVIGVTTAYELAAEGHEVVVFERRGGVAAEASFGHGGLVSSGHIAPWAAPGMPLKLLRETFRTHATMRLRSGVNAAALGWLWKWSRACRKSTAQANRLRLQRLAAFSRVRLHRLTHDLHLDYERAEGVLVLLRTPAELALARPALKLLAESPTRFKLLDAQRCRVVEPGLNPEAALHAGIYLPDDEVANCRQFSMLMRLQAHKRGVEFRLHTEVLKIVPGRKPQVVAEQHDPEEPALQSTFGMPLDQDDGGRTHTAGPVVEAFDGVVLCCALGASALLRPHGVHLPVQAVHGYSVTAPLRHLEAHPDHGPRAGLIDEGHQVSISRIGSRVRVAGGAEIGGALSRHHPAALATLYKVLDDWFPGVARLGQAQPWKGARALLPDGPPVLGASGIDGVWLNLGHGDHGWTLACGCARLLAETMAGRAPSIDPEGLGVDRLRL